MIKDTQHYIIKVDKNGYVAGSPREYEGERQSDEVFIPSYMLSIPVEKLQYTSNFWKVTA